MIQPLLQGMLLGLAYLAPLGMQNIYIINSALSLSRFRAVSVALVTIFFDISLALACFFGIGFLIERNIFVKAAVLAIGALVVIYIGIKLIRSRPELVNKIKNRQTILGIIGDCFAIAWFNPQAIIDGSLLFGSYKAILAPSASALFISGVCLASFSWFMLLTLGVNSSKKLISNEKLKIINIICGIVLIFYGLNLAWGFFKIIF